jgi:hypothetical protein
MTVNLRLCPLKNIWGTLVSRVISFFPKTFGHTIIYLPPHKKKNGIAGNVIYAFMFFAKL